MKKFLFCATTNAFQIEGGRHLGGRHDSVWDEFTKRRFYIPKTNKPEREINSIEVASDFYHQYPIDAKICGHLNLDALVYCLDWTRIFPKNSTSINMQGIKFYQDVFESFYKQNVKIIPILFHWDTPMWAQKKGGWENRECVKWFKHYAEVIFKYLGKYIDICLSSDENSSFTTFGYLDTYFPPERNNPTAFVKAVHHLALGSAATKEAFLKAKKLKWIKKDAILGIDHDWSPPLPYPNNSDSKMAVKAYNEWHLGLYYDPYLLGTYSKIFYDFIKENKVNFKISSKDLSYLKKYHVDLIGWNYYRPFYVSDYNYKMTNSQKPSELSKTHKFQIVYPKKNVKYTKWNWTIDPSQIIPGLKFLHKRYGKNTPVMILENGMGDFDDKSKQLILDKTRIQYLHGHIKEVIKARQQGLNIMGYSLWTYCDIFSPSGGYRKDYGLVSVDFNNKNKTRKPKLSYVWYKNVIKSNGSDLSMKWTKLIHGLNDELIYWQKNIAK